MASFDAHFCTSGWGEIRTHDPVTQVTVFKTVALDHSATHPYMYSHTVCGYRFITKNAGFRNAHMLHYFYDFCS